MWTRGKPHRERTRKEARQDDCKNQRTAPSSSVKPRTRVWERQMPPHWVRPVTSACLSSFPPLLWHVFSLSPCHFQMSSLHPHPPWSLLTSLPASSLIHLLRLSTSSSKAHPLKMKVLPGPSPSAVSSLPAGPHLEALWHTVKCLTHSFGVCRFS